MNAVDCSTVQIVSVLGPALALGFMLGWILAIANFGGSSNSSDCQDKDK